jgi:hypothetical protein
MEGDEETWTQGLRINMRYINRTPENRKWKLWIGGS